MKIVVISQQYSQGMGYIENKLPEFLAALGSEVHLVTTNVRANPLVPGLDDWEGSKVFPRKSPLLFKNGVAIHCLPVRRVLRLPRLISLRSLLQQLRPDVVQTHDMAGWTTLDPARWQRELGYCLFGGAHRTMSVFPRADLLPWLSWPGIKGRLSRLLYLRLPSQYGSRYMEKCYAATSDCAIVAERFLGVPKSKIELLPLGVDTDLFHPINNGEERRICADLRQRLGLHPDEVVCLYTGKFTSEKNPLLLAQAVARLQGEGLPFRGFFVGAGEQKEAIAACSGCITVPFQPHCELGAFYRCSDIGVWPTQESMSMLDAAACGLPIVVNHTVQATERFEGNGLTYQLNNLEDLVAALRRLQAKPLRESLGRNGADKVRRCFSWSANAAHRLRDYEQAIARQESVVS